MIKNRAVFEAAGNHERWLNIRKELFRQMQSQVHRRLGEEKGELRKYRHEYENEFDKKWEPVAKKDFLASVLNSKILLLADFHALHQSQKAHLRILKEFPKDRKLILLLECFQDSDQEHLDNFLRGQISEKEFLKMTHWHQRWGFPWDHYRSVLRWAHHRRVLVCGINRDVKGRGRASLRSRDVFAAQKITEMAMNNTESTVVVIYGDLHLAKSHIPALLDKKLGKSFRQSVCRVFQNSEKIYFQLLRKEIEQNVDVVKLGPQTFCLMSVPPWVKWQNYLMYLEAKYDPLLEEDQDDALDYTDHVGQFVKIIAEELGLKVDFQRLSIYTAKDFSFWKKISEHFNKTQLKWIEIYIEEEVSFYIPELNMGYLARSTVNHAAILAMQFIHSEISKREFTPVQLEKDFLQLIWIEAVSYFGSKIINHKRKADTLSDIKMALSAKHSQDGGREAYQLTLFQKMNELMMLSRYPKNRRVFKPRHSSSYLRAAQLLAGMMGERLYNGYRRKIISVATLTEILRKPVLSKKYEQVYHELLEVVESLPISFRSKKEKL